jgi:hypothetical protein
MAVRLGGRLGLSVTCHHDRFRGDAMVLTIVAFCAAGAILLFGLGIYAEFQELRMHPGHRFDANASHQRKPGSK